MTTESHWRVDVYIDGQQILSIEPNMVAGSELTDDQADIVRTCAHHLHSFAGSEKCDDSVFYE